MTQAKCGRKSFLRGTGKRIAGPAFIALAICLSCSGKSCRAAEVSVSIHLDADFVALIRGVRRANGIDPPDSAADRRLADILAKARERQHERCTAARLTTKPTAGCFEYAENTQAQPGKRFFPVDAGLLVQSNPL